MLGAGPVDARYKMCEVGGCLQALCPGASGIKSAATTGTAEADEMQPVRKDKKNGPRRGLLERLASGEIIIGDGGFVFALEKRGYVKAGPWTPEATVEHPEALRQLHREFLRAGSTVMQTFTFYASDDKLMNRGNYVEQKISGNKVNEAACDIARGVANEGDALVAGGVSQTPSYLSNKSETLVKAIFRKQLDVFVKKNVDFLIAEYFEHVEEAEWAVHVMKVSGKAVAATLCIGPEGDMAGVSAGDCAVRLVKAGADIVGVNCHFDPATCLKTMKLMKEGLEAAKLKAHLMVQPLAFHTPDCSKQGFIDLPEFPFALEPRIATRWDIHKYARNAYDLGIRYIGGCCGFEPYHIRAIAEELATERGFLPAGSEKHDAWGTCFAMHTKPWVRARAQRAYWEKMLPATGLPYSPSFSKPDSWGVTKGDEVLIQQVEVTSNDQLKEMFEKQKRFAGIIASFLLCNNRKTK
ncbi:betaine--homocysteine S-methyltransferase 1-like [Leucoraja erinacea]|uniref:betaine--homocysteine S-methyltransferase 1-like n=1 Tax=Leucoraja erinaceus TaxID=7782 RepID=UPI002456890C|nr:betaine--homocysteine S-methyltransferase 1-like [Leucoraja erinacea]